jgi:RNA polymerase sigma-70 factor (ECF subfamily)
MTGSGDTTMEPIQTVQCVTAACHGSTEAFGTLVRAHQRQVYGYLVRMVRDPGVAADLAQTVFLKSWDALPSLREPALFLPWLLAIAANQARNWLATERRRAAWVLPVGSGDEQEAGGSHESAVMDVADAGPCVSPYDAADLAELRRCIDGALARLPDTLREVAVLRFQHGLKVTGIASVLGLGVAAVESRLRRARKILCEGLRGVRGPTEGLPDLGGGSR